MMRALPVIILMAQMMDRHQSICMSNAKEVARPMSLMVPCGCYKCCFL